MAELSRFHTIAPAKALLETEIDIALQKRFGAPDQVRDHPVFGLGFGHVCGDPDMGFWDPPSKDELRGRLPSGLRSRTAGA